jgi:hypothetical protein
MESQLAGRPFEPLQIDVTFAAPDPWDGGRQRPTQARLKPCATTEPVAMAESRKENAPVSCPSRKARGAPTGNHVVADWLHRHGLEPLPSTRQHGDEDYAAPFDEWAWEQATSEFVVLVDASVHTDKEARDRLLAKLIARYGELTAARSPEQQGGSEDRVGRRPQRALARTVSRGR